MSRPLTAIPFILAGFAALAAAPAEARTGYYQAETAAPPAQQRFAARDNYWRCEGQSCSSHRSPARPAIVCAALAERAGPVAAFRANGSQFGPGELERCNRGARAD